MKAKIISVGSYLPAKIQKSDDLLTSIDIERRHGIPTTWLSESLGIKERRVAAINEHSSDLALNATRKALQRAQHIDLSEIGAVLFCGIERDQVEPATAHTIQHKLGLNAPIAFDISNACYGFIEGMRIAQSLIELGHTKYVLVATGEVHRHVVNYFADQLKRNLPKEHVMKILGFMSAGDAGGAVIMGASKSESGFVDFYGRSDPSHYSKCYYRQSVDGGYAGEMIMPKMVAVGFSMHRKMVKNSLTQLGWKQADWLVSHQTGQRGFEKIANLNTAPRDRLIKTYHDLGNITTATFPVSFDRLLQNPHIQPGDKVFGIFGGSGFVVGQFGYIIPKHHWPMHLSEPEPAALAALF